MALEGADADPRFGSPSRATRPLGVHMRTRTPAFRPWGRFDATPDLIAGLIRSSRYTLTVYPPGTSRSERVLLTIASGGGWVTGTFILAAALFMHMLFGAVGLVGTLGAIVAVWLVARWTTRTLRQDSRSISITASARAIHGVESFIEAMHRLDALEKFRGDPVLYELEWAHVYDWLGDRRTR